MDPRFHKLTTILLVFGLQGPPRPNARHLGPLALDDCRLRGCTGGSAKLRLPILPQSGSMAIKECHPLFIRPDQLVVLQ
jgi:hypothetical protein